MPGCTEAMEMADGKLGTMGDCRKGMTGDCMAKMGCTTVAPPIAPLFVLTQVAAPRPMVFSPVNETRTGHRPPPLYGPPKQHA